MPQRAFDPPAHPPQEHSARGFSTRAIRAATTAPGLLRCSMGLEDRPDLHADFDAGLAAATAA